MEQKTQRNEGSAGEERGWRSQEGLGARGQDGGQGAQGAWSIVAATVMEDGKK
jgi:hypothetical protein